MTKENKLDFYFKESVEASRASIYHLLTRPQDAYSLDDLLARVTDHQLWRLVEIFKDERNKKKYWRGFLIALLNIPAPDWTDRKLMPDYAGKVFTIEDRAEIRYLYYIQMVTDGRHSPILQFL